jgi:hypothetical protein
MQTLLESISSGPRRSQDRSHPAVKIFPIGKALVMGLIMVAAACGGTAKPDSTAKPAGMMGEQCQMGEKGQMDEKCQMGQMGDKGGMGEKGEMANMPPQIAKFHDTLAPRWHAAHGPQRMADTCGAMAQFHTDADAIATSQAPSGGDAAAWSAGGKQLTEAVTALETTCKANDAAAFEPAFERVHKTFHGLMEAAMGQHGEHGEHGEHHH